MFVCVLLSFVIQQVASNFFVTLEELFHSDCVLLPGTGMLEVTKIQKVL